MTKTATCKHCGKRPRTSRSMAYVNRQGQDRYYWSCKPCRDVFAGKLNAEAQVLADAHWNALVAQGLVVGLPTGSISPTPLKDPVSPTAPKKVDSETGRSPVSLPDISGLRPSNDVGGLICDTPAGFLFKSVLIPLVERLGAEEAVSLCRTYKILSRVKDGFDGVPYEDPTVDTLVQECRIMAWAKMGEFLELGEDELEPYARTFCRNVCIDYLRSEKIIKRDDVSDAEVYKRPLSLDAGGDDLEGLHEAIAGLDGSVHADEGSERLDAVLEAVANVAGSDYLFLYYAGVPDEQVAKDKNVSLAAVRQNRSRAMARARKAVEGIH